MKFDWCQFGSGVVAGTLYYHLHLHSDLMLAVLYLICRFVSDPVSWQCPIVHFDTVEVSCSWGGGMGSCGGEQLTRSTISGTSSKLGGGQSWSGVNLTHHGPGLR
jgi:hypothetical protein